MTNETIANFNEQELIEFLTDNQSHPTKMLVIQRYMRYLDALTDSPVNFLEMAKIVQQEQARFEPDLTIKEASQAINSVMKKRDTHFSFLTAIQNDLATQFGHSIEPFQSIVADDRGTFGNDEQNALNIAELYGTIGVTNFGYLDREKIGFIKEIDQLGKTNPNITTTYIDDVLSAVIAAAEAYVAHLRDKGHDEEPDIDVIDTTYM